MADLVGRLLDHFQVEALLGEGGMGAVYKARDLRLQRDVAIKVLHHHIAQQADFKKRFLQEARSAARLDHPGIVKVYYFGQEEKDDLLYIVMQFISGANLRQMLEDLKAQEAWVPLDEGVQLVRQVSVALNYAHQRGVLHRDIKPNNIMIEPEPSNGLPYRAIITDLGLAKLAESTVVTREGSSLGTPAYMSPEQALGEPTDARSDVYSLGVLLYELAVGHVPFPAKTITQAIRYHTKEPPPAPRTIRPDLPDAVERIILRALEKDPDDRYPDAAAFAEALETIKSAVTAPTVTPTAQMNAVSLITQYQQSLSQPRGPSILKEFDTPFNLTQDSVQVLVDGKVVDTVTLMNRTLTLGRGQDNDVVLDDPRASRHHAQIESDGTQYKVLDLDSRNGTFLGDTELLPGVPDVWRSDQAMHIGNTWLRLVRVQEPAEWGDPTAALTIDPEHAQRRVGPGPQAKTSAQASPQQQPWTGKKETDSFSTEVQSSAENVQTHSGNVTSRGRIPAWLLGVFAFGALVVIGAGLLIPRILGLLSEPTPLPLPTATATATLAAAEVTDTPGPTPTLTPSPSPTVDWEAVFQERAETLLTQIRYREANGDVLWAYKTTAPPVLDGSLDEWAPRAYPVSHVVHNLEGTTWQGANDLYGSSYLVWDDGFLYLGVQVTDDVHAQTETGASIFRGDEVEIQVDTKLDEDFDDTTLSDDDIQIGFSPGNFSTLEPEVHIWRPANLEQSGAMIELAARKTGTGYVLETAIPWWVLQGRPPTETPVGITINVSDNDNPNEAQQIRLLSNSPNRTWGDPTTWGTLILVDWGPNANP